MADGESNIGAVMTRFVERVERLIEERKGINDDIKDIKSEAKGQGLDPKMIDYAVRMRKLLREERETLLAEQQATLEALGLA